MEPGVYFSLFHGKALGLSDFLLSGVLMQDIVERIEGGEWEAGLARVFGVGEVQEAYRLLDSGAAGGKIVMRR